MSQENPSILALREEYSKIVLNDPEEEFDNSVKPIPPPQNTRPRRGSLTLNMANIKNQVDQMKKIFHNKTRTVSEEDYNVQDSNSSLSRSSENLESASAQQSNPSPNDKKASSSDKEKHVTKRRGSLLSLIAENVKKSIIKTKPSLEDLDSIIEKLLLCSAKISSSKFPLSAAEIQFLCNEARNITLNQSAFLEISGPIKVCGDIHGQFKDLISIFELCGSPKNTNYLFLGDYVDRGKQSLETIFLLMCYKIKYPETFFLLRGNHECSSINRVYGFFDECKRRSSMKTWKEVSGYFDVLPLAACISQRIFCVHGGISPDLNDLNTIRNIQRPLDITDTGIEADLLWADPADTTRWQMNESRGVSYCFGPPQIDEFLKKFDFDLIARAHMVVEDGFEFFHNRKLVTLFSAPDYCGEFQNKGGIMLVDADLHVTFKLLDNSVHRPLQSGSVEAIHEHESDIEDSLSSIDSRSTK